MEKETAIHSSILVWRIPWTEEPDRLQSIGSHRVRHDLSDLVKDMRIKSTSYRDPPPPSVVRKSKSVAGKEPRNVVSKVSEFYEETTVKFSELSEEMLWEYIDSGEPM